MVTQSRRIANRFAAGAACRLRLPRMRALLAIVLAITAGASLLSTLGREPSHTAHAEGAIIEPLARGQFSDDVRAFLFVRPEGSHPMDVIHVTRASDAIALKLTVPPGASVDWHTHPGPGIAVVAAGEITLTFGPNCETRTYPAGSALIHGAESQPDLAENRGDTDLVIYVTFIGTPPGPPTIPHEAPDC